MRATLFISIIFFLCAPVFAQDISGNWTGNIDVNGNQLPIVFHFNKDNSGNIVGKWDSPKQNAIGLSFSAIKIDEDSVNLDMKIIAGSYQGKFVNNDSISGIWKQSQHEFPLNFSRTKENADHFRNQYV